MVGQPQDGPGLKMEKNELIQKTASELLEKLGIQTEKVEAVVDAEGSYQVAIESVSDSGVLIGYHGENLNSLQKILSLICYKQSGEWVPLVVDVQGYRDERRSRLEELAENAAKRARFLQDPVTLPPMSAYERRLVHTKVAEIDGVWTESTGEGRDRRVVIRPGTRPEGSGTAAS